MLRDFNIKKAEKKPKKQLDRLIRKVFIGMKTGKINFDFEHNYNHNIIVYGFGTYGLNIKIDEEKNIYIVLHHQSMPVFKVENKQTRELILDFTEFMIKVDFYSAYLMHLKSATNL